MTSSLDGLPIWATAIILILLLVVANVGGYSLRRRLSPGAADDDSGQEGLLISAILGLLALLMGFTFALAVERFETRRLLVLEEANAIRTTFRQKRPLGVPYLCGGGHFAI